MQYSLGITQVVSSELDDATLLPGYYYRDDGLKLWDAIEQYVRDVVNEFYASDDDVKQDKEKLGS